MDSVNLCTSMQYLHYSTLFSLLPKSRKSVTELLSHYNTRNFCRWELSDLEMETYLTTQSAVYHIERDRYIPGHVIFADRRILQTTDGSSTQDIVGSELSGYAEGRGKEARFTESTHLSSCQKHMFL